jgi:hypothetical protein
MTNDFPADTPTGQEEPPLASAYAILAFFCIALVMFGDLLFQMGDTAVSHSLSDGSQYFSRMRDFGFSELAKGNMPLWNPHVFSGTPFVGAFQSGMFYPLNLMYMVLPLANAMNADAAIHIFLLNVFMFLWARKQGLSLVASFLASILLAYGGASFTRIMAGHITMLQAFAWAPLILLSIDHVLEKRSNGWLLIGVGATTMQILAGYPPAVFITALAAGIYCGAKLVRSEDRLGSVVRLIPYGVFPPLIACVQLWTGWDTTQESMRSAGVSYDFATSFSFHPESLLTLLMPTLFGNVMHVMYWGRWAFWDSTIFIGIGGLALVICSAYYGSTPIRRYSFTLLIVFMILALGSYTPIYRWLYEFVPGFNSFRSPAIFMFPASLFATILAGLGMDALLRGKVTSKKVPVGVTLIGCSLLTGAAWLGMTSLGSEPNYRLRRFIDYRESLDESLFISLAGVPLPDEYYVQIARLAFLSCLIAGITCLALGAALWNAKVKTWVVYVVPIVAIFEVLIFSRIHRPTFQLADNDRPNFDEMYARVPGNYRMMDVPGIDNSKRNYAVSSRKYAIWGYDPVILDRYSQFVSFAASGDKRAFDPVLMDAAIQGVDPMVASIHELKNYTFHSNPNRIKGDTTLFALLRCRYFIVNPGEWNVPASYWFIGGDLPRFFFSNAYSVHATKKAIFDEMKKDTFEPGQRVLLESEPVPKPAELGEGNELSGSINVVSETTDSIELDIQVDRNTLLIITDSYSKNWRVVALANSVQAHYDVMPVDYTVRGIPLAAGTHRFVLEYAPKSYTVGRWISVGGLLFYVLCCCYVVYRNNYTHPASKKASPEDQE